MKRRATIQTQINQNFANHKNINKNQNASTMAALYDKTDPSRGLNLHFQSGAQKSATPYRSLGRVNNLLKGTGFSSAYGQGKFVETTQNAPDKLCQQNMDKFNEMSTKPSSCATATTKATTAYDYADSKRDQSSKVAKKRDVKKQGKKGVPEKIPCKAGTKRQSPSKLDIMEVFTRHIHHSEDFMLYDKKTGDHFTFDIFNQRYLKGFNKSEIVRNFDMTKLEVEYDYDTDGEQLRQSKKMLVYELTQAIDFYVRDEPLKLITNVLI